MLTISNRLPFKTQILHYQNHSCCPYSARSKTSSSSPIVLAVVASMHITGAFWGRFCPCFSAQSRLVCVSRKNVKEGLFRAAH